MFYVARWWCGRSVNSLRTLISATLLPVKQMKPSHLSVRVSRLLCLPRNSVWCPLLHVYLSKGILLASLKDESSTTNPGMNGSDIALINIHISPSAFDVLGMK